MSLQDARAYVVKRKTPEGHEAPLAAMIKNRTHAKITLLSGEVVTGIITAFDKFTVSMLRHEEDFPITVFKHGILSFTRDL